MPQTDEVIETREFFDWEGRKVRMEITYTDSGWYETPYMVFHVGFINHFGQQDYDGKSFGSLERARGWAEKMIAFLQKP